MDDVPHCSTQETTAVIVYMWEFFMVFCNSQNFLLKILVLKKSKAKGGKKILSLDKQQYNNMKLSNFFSKNKK